MPRGNPERRERIMSMLDSGMTQAEVASVFGITPTRVGQIKRCEILRRKQAATPLYNACLDLNLDTGLASRISAACRRSGKDWREDDMSNVRTIGPLCLTIIERAKELSND